MSSSRKIARKVILNVIRGASLTDALCEQKFLNAREQSFVYSLCFGVCRWYYRLNGILNLLLEKPLTDKNKDIQVVILLGLYQLIYMRVPEHASVSETVSMAKELKKIWAKGLINAVLRNYQRNTEEVNIKIKQNEEAEFAHPTWLIQKIKEDWPHDWKIILNANNEHPPFALRVNQHFISRKDYQKKLMDAFPERIVSVIEETKSGIVLDKAIDVVSLPGFKEGEISVQDGASQWVVNLLDLSPKQLVLDACCAPGGKLTAMLEIEPSLEVIGIDQDNDRLKKVRDNLKRLKLNTNLVCADASHVSSWWDGRLFDCILLDAPCSGSGVIRRHPDIKLLRLPSDILKLTEQQLHLCNSLWTVLKPGGLMLYTTCSIFKDENVRVVKKFLDQHPDAFEEKILVEWTKDCEVGRQILPGFSNMDGFYFAKLRKTL